MNNTITSIKSFIGKKIKIELFETKSTCSLDFISDCKNLIFTISEVRSYPIDHNKALIVLINDKISNHLRQWLLSVYFYNNIIETIFKIIPIGYKCIVI